MATRRDSRSQSSTFDPLYRYVPSAGAFGDDYDELGYATLPRGRGSPGFAGLPTDSVFAAALAKVQANPPTLRQGQTADSIKSQMNTVIAALEAAQKTRKPTAAIEYQLAGLAVLWHQARAAEFHAKVYTEAKKLGLTKLAADSAAASVATHNAAAGGSDNSPMLGDSTLEERRQGNRGGYDDSEFSEAPASGWEPPRPVSAGDKSVPIGTSSNVIARLAAEAGHPNDEFLQLVQTRVDQGQGNSSIPGIQATSRYQVPQGARSAIQDTYAKAHAILNSSYGLSTGIPRYDLRQPRRKADGILFHGLGDFFGDIFKTVTGAAASIFPPNTIVGKLSRGDVGGALKAVGAPPRVAMRIAPAFPPPAVIAHDDPPHRKGFGGFDTTTLAVGGAAVLGLGWYFLAGPGSKKKAA